MLKSMPCRLMIFCVKKRALYSIIVLVSTTISSDRCILLQSCGSLWLLQSLVSAVNGQALVSGLKVEMSSEPYLCIGKTRVS